jgi:EAL domain-containing protein (putative c-di-GMP-specific phosphodiesterase class I)
MTTSDPVELMSLEHIIRDRNLKVVFQPILELSTNKPFAYEALVRCPVPGYQAPPMLFEKAIHASVVGELGRAIRQLSVDGCPSFPLFLNVHPVELESGWLVRPDDGIFIHEHPVYLEITESVPLTHADTCAGMLRELRSKGMNVAVDDLGAGYSNLRYIADLAPEIVKLDRELIIDLTVGSRRFKLVKHLVTMCEDLGARVVAEGIETEAELEAVRAAGVHLGQGYLIARPAFPPPAVMRFGLMPPDEGLA